MEWFQGEILLRAGGCLLQECGDRESKLQASAAFWNHCPHRLGSLGSSERLRFRFHFSFRASPVCSDQQPQISGKCSKSSRPPTANCDALLLSSWTQRIVKLCWISKSLKLNALTAVLKSCRWWERLTAPGRSESLPNQRKHKAQSTITYRPTILNWFQPGESIAKGWSIDVHTWSIDEPSRMNIDVFCVLCARRHGALQEGHNHHRRRRCQKLGDFQFHLCVLHGDSEGPKVLAKFQSFKSSVEVPHKKSEDHGLKFESYLETNPTIVRIHTSSHLLRKKRRPPCLSLVVQTLAKQDPRCILSTQKQHVAFQALLLGRRTSSLVNVSCLRITSYKCQAADNSKLGIAEG